MNERLIIVVARSCVSVYVNVTHNHYPKAVQCMHALCASMKALTGKK